MARILVIDDAPDIRALLSSFLAKAGHEVVTVESAEHGLAELRRGNHDIALLDMEMPGVNGLACLAMVRGDPALARTPVFMVTATPLREVVLCVAKLGVQGIVIKKDNWVRGLVEQVNRFLSSRTAPPAQAAAAQPAKPLANIHTKPAAPAAPAQTPAPSPKGETALGAAVAPLDVSWMPAELADGDGHLTDERSMELLKSLKPIIARSELLDAMLDQAVSVRALKPAAQQVLALTGRSQSSIHDVVNAIRQDQALSIRILKMANSTLYARGERVDSVAKAVSRIGLAQIRSAVLGIAVLDAFGSYAGSEAFRADWFWEHSSACGLLAMRLAQAFGRPREHCETMFTAGLLHDIGRLLFAEQLPEHYPRVIQAAERLELPLETVESRLLLMNHADITDRLLRHWNFAPAMVAPVAFHHLSVGNAKSTSPRSADDVVVLGLANRLSHAMLLGCSGNEVLYPIEEFVDHLRLGSEAIRDIRERAAGELADLRTNMLLHAGTSGAPYVASVRRQFGDARPLTLALRPDIDPVSIMADALWGAAPPDAPNLITLRIHSARDREAARRLLNETCASLDARSPGREPLPVLVLGDSRSCLFADGVLSGRPLRQVTLPRSVHRLARDMHELVSLTATLS